MLATWLFLSNLTTPLKIGKQYETFHKIQMALNHMKRYSNSFIREIEINGSNY